MENLWKLDDIHSAFQAALEEVIRDRGDDKPDEATLAKIVREASADFVPKMSETIYADLDERAPEMLIERREIRRRFVERNVRRWQAGFDLLERMIVISEEIGQAVSNSLREDAVNDDNPLFEALITNHARAVVVAREILALMVAGFPDGALGRWRTLHEIAVESGFILKHGVDAARRYIWQEHVAAYQRAANYMEYHERANLSPYSAEELEEFKVQRDAVVAKDERFSKLYGWAAITLDKKQVNFFDIEEAAGLSHWRPRYKWATTNTHGGYGDHLSLARSESASPVLLSGESNSGMTDPGHMTAITLTTATFPVTQLAPTLDGEIFIQIMLRLSSETGKAFWHASGLDVRPTNPNPSAK